MGADFQPDLVPGPPNPAETRRDHLRPRSDWEPRTFSGLDKRDSDLLIHALALHATQEDHARVLDQPERGPGREVPGAVAGLVSMARKIILNPADLELLREACLARGGEIKALAEADFEANFARATSAVHLAQLGYFEALPDEGWRLKAGLKAKVKAALKVEPA
jgi:hypothetical protein